MKHTQGNWSLKLNYDNNLGETIEGRHTIVADDWNIARIWESGNDKETVLANARLMTAAPDLFEALNNLLKVTARHPIDMEKLLEANEKARDAIRKATNQ